MNQILQSLVDQKDLSANQVARVIELMMRGELDSEVIAGILVSWKIKGETVEELTSAAKLMSNFAQTVDIEDEMLVDIVGTGGDGLKTFNISTAAMFVAGGAGVKIAKHGGRSVSSTSGSADVIKQMGADFAVDTEIDRKIAADNVVKSIKNCGIGFMFAPIFHPAMKFVAPIRQKLKIKTIFNLLGPLLNPAKAKRQVLGVANKDLVNKMAQVLINLNIKRGLVLHGLEGLDEISLQQNTLIAEINNQSIKQFIFNPENFGFNKISDYKELQVTTTEQSLDKINQVLNGVKNPCRDVVILNAAAAIYLSSNETDFNQGFYKAIFKAKESIDSGKALALQQKFIKQSF